METEGFNEYLKYQGIVNAMANSIELLMNCIFEKLKVKVDSRSMLGIKIIKFEKNENIWSSKYKGDKKNLIDGLNEFNTTWNITKHGMIVVGKEKLTFHKDGQFYSFNQQKQEEISREFTFIMQELTQIHEAF